MCRRTIVWLIVAASLVIIGGIIFVGVMAVLNWNFAGLSTVRYEMNEYEIHEHYHKITIVTDMADIAIVVSENTESSVVCYEQKNALHTVTVKDDTLVIEVDNTKKWYDYIGVNFGSPKITVSIPLAEYGALFIQSDTGDVEIPKDISFEIIDVLESTGDVTSYASASKMKIQTSTGNIHVENVSVNTMDLSVSTGKVTLSNAVCEDELKIRVSTGKVSITDTKCKNLVSSGNTGSITMQNVVASEMLSIQRSTGDVRFDMCDAAEIMVKTSTGDVKGSLLTDKVFITHTDTGDVKVPKTVTGGKCEINTHTGDIRISIP